MRAIAVVSVVVLSSTGCYVATQSQPSATPSGAFPSGPVAAAPPGATGPVTTDVSVNVAGEDVPSVDVFYAELAPYGSWYDDPTYGRVFAPPSPTYIPFANGRWLDTDYGLTWVSGDPFGWATDHYGRWAWSNRWVWRPDTTWGPAWVQWRAGNGYVGWAPVGPSDNAYFPVEHWRFVAGAQLFAPRLGGDFLVGNVGGYVTASAPIRRYVRTPRGTWAAGPGDDWLRRNHVEPRRERPTLAQMGRYTEEQRRDAEMRAREHQREQEARRLRDEQARRQREAQQRQADENQRRIAEQQRRQADEELRRKAEEQRRREEDQRRRFANDMRRRDEEARRAQRLQQGDAGKSREGRRSRPTGRDQVGHEKPGHDKAGHDRHP